MDVNYISDFNLLNEQYLINLKKYIILNENMHNYLLYNTNMNFLLILFTMSCLCSLVYSNKRQRGGYLHIQDAQPVNAELIHIQKV